MTAIREIAPTPPDDFWLRYHAFRRAIHTHDEPDEPLDSDARAEVWITYGSPNRDLRRWEMAGDGGMLGYLFVGGPSPTDPTYESNKRFANVSIRVHPDHRRRRVATELLKVALADIERRGAEIAQNQTSNEAGHALSEALGGEVKSTERLSRCLIAKVDGGMIRTWADEGRLRNPETRLKIVDGITPDDMLDGVVDLLNELENLVPQEDAEHGEIRVTADSHRQWEERMEKNGVKRTIMYSVDADGRLSGYTGIIREPDKPQILYQHLTGVRRRHQGRGLAKWLKAQMYLEMTGRHPEATEIRTGNASSNDPMFSINRRMGFEIYKVQKFYQAPIGKLREYLAGR